MPSSIPFPILGKPGSPNGDPRKGGLSPRWLGFNDDGSGMGSSLLTLASYARRGSQSGSGLPPFLPCLLPLVVNPITVGDAVTPASGRDRISLSRKLSCQDYMRIPPYVSILPAVPRQVPVLAERITHPHLNQALSCQL